MSESKRHGRTRANGMGTAERHGSSWRARVVVGWKVSPDETHKIPIWRTKSGFKSKRDALNFCATLLGEYEKPKIAPTLESYWNVYSDGEILKLSGSKQTAYKIAWNRLKDFWYRKVDTLTVQDVRSAVEGLTYYPARDVKTLLSHLFKLAGADGWVSKDLPSYIVLPKLEETEQTPFNEEEQKAFWKLWESGDEQAAIPLVMIYTGMMPAEAMKLTCEMIDFDARQIVGVGSKTAVRKKSAIYLSETILPVLQAITEGKTGKIWRMNKDRFYVVYYEVLARAGTRKLPPYSCRHTTATALAIDQNVAPQTVKKIMRWSTTRMLDRYAHPDSEDVFSAVDSFGKAQDS